MNLEEIERLRELIAREERLEQDLRSEVREAVKARDKKLIRELSRLENRNRRVVMWIGVILLMLIIFGFWVSQLDSLIRSPLTDQGSAPTTDLLEIKNNLESTVGEVVKGIDEIKQQAKALDGGSATSSPSSSEPFAATSTLNR